MRGIVDKGVIYEYHWLFTENKMLEIELLGLEEQIESGATAVLSHAKSRNSGNAADTFDEYITAKENLERRIERNMFRLTQLRAKIEDMFARVRSPELRCILRMRYLKQVTWDEIAAKMKTSRTTLRRKFKGYVE